MLRHLPNALTFARILSIPIVAFLILDDSSTGVRWAAFFVFALSCLTDFVDGWVARRFNGESRLGRVLDPIADKVLVAVCLLALVSVGTVANVHVYAAAIILSREILVSGLREFLAGLDAGALVRVTQLAKWKTVVQMSAIASLVLGPAGDAMFGHVTDLGLALLWVASGLTIWTGMAYFLAGWPFLVAPDETPGDKQ